MTTPTATPTITNPPPNCGPPPEDLNAKNKAASQAASADYVYTVADGPNPCGLQDMARVWHVDTPEEQQQVVDDILAEREAPVGAPQTDLGTSTVWSSSPTAATPLSTPAATTPPTT
ncbi:MAG TPA: hypothetical protein VH439_17360 [Gemmatimonadales bacterium]|jgi:hypothetical protein